MKEEKKKKQEKKKTKKEQPRSFHAKWRFRSTGITLNLRIGSAVEREHGKESEKERTDRENERDRCSHVGTIDKCTCIPSYCISSNYPPRSYQRPR